MKKIIREIREMKKNMQKEIGNEENHQRKEEHTKKKQEMKKIIREMKNKTKKNRK